MRLNIKHHIDSEFVVNMIQIYMNSLGDSLRPNKAEFMRYMKRNIEMFGSNHESQFGQMEREISDDAVFYLGKWFSMEYERGE